MTKKQETDSTLNKLRLINYSVFHFNDNRRMPAGLFGHADHEVFGDYAVFLIHDKFPGDAIRDSQKPFIGHINRMGCNNVIMQLNDGSDIAGLIEEIINIEERLRKGKDLPDMKFSISKYYPKKVELRNKNIEDKE